MGWTWQACTWRHLNFYFQALCFTRSEPFHWRHNLLKCGEWIDCAMPTEPIEHSRVTSGDGHLSSWAERAGGSLLLLMCVGRGMSSLCLVQLGYQLALSTAGSQALIPQYPKLMEDRVGPLHLHTQHESMSYYKSLHTHTPSNKHISVFIERETDRQAFSICCFTPWAPAQATAGHSWPQLATARSLTSSRSPKWGSGSKHLGHLQLPSQGDGPGGRGQHSHLCFNMLCQLCRRRFNSLSHKYRQMDT